MKTVRSPSSGPLLTTLFVHQDQKIEFSQRKGSHLYDRIFVETRQSPSCLPTEMMCNQCTVPFIRFRESSRNSAPTSQIRMLNAICVVRPSACHNPRFLDRAEDEQETPVSTRNCLRTRKPVYRVCAQRSFKRGRSTQCHGAGVLLWHPRRQTTEVNLEVANAHFEKLAQKLFGMISTP